MKIVRINFCQQCPYYKSGWFCGHVKGHGKDLANPSTQIQEWCPLEDAELSNADIARQINDME